MPCKLHDLAHPEAAQRALLAEPLELSVIAADPVHQLGQGMDEYGLVTWVVRPPLPVGEVLLQGLFRGALPGTPGGGISHKPLDGGSVRLTISTDRTQLVTQPYGSPTVPGQAGNAHYPAHRDFKRPIIELIQRLTHKRQHVIGGRHLCDCSDPGTSQVRSSKISRSVHRRMRVPVISDWYVSSF